MSAGKRPRQQRQSQQAIIYEEESNDVTASPYPLKRAARAPPELDTCLEVVTSALSNPNRALLRSVFFIAEDKSKYVSGILPCPRLSAASRIWRRQETASAPQRSAPANYGRQYRGPVQRSVYKRTF